MRALIRRNPVALRVVDPIVDEFDRLARFMWDSWELPFFSTSPAMDVYRENKEFIVKTELPGMDREEIDINLKDNVLTVIAEKRNEDEGNGHREFRRYHRSVTLPGDVDGDKVSATYENGLLEIRFPEAPEIESRHIEVEDLEKPKTKAKAKTAKPKGAKKAKKSKTKEE